MVLVENFGGIFIHRRVADASFDKKKRTCRIKTDTDTIRIRTIQIMHITHKNNSYQTQRRTVAIKRVDSGVPGTC
jgi:hypothetical protein